MHKNLRSFIDVLRRENEIVEINAEVDPYLEVAEIHRRVIDAEGKALLFRNVKGSTFPVVTNLFGTRKRIDLAFGSKPLDFRVTVTTATLWGWIGAGIVAAVVLGLIVVFWRLGRR